MIESLSSQIRAYCLKHTLLVPGTMLVGVSGGADSLTLLNVLITLRAEFDLRLHVATLDHGIRGAESAGDAEYVRSLAENWQLPITVGYVDTPAFAASHAMGIEEAARAVRYDFFRQTAHTVGAERIAVAHNRDDQAETVLMHVLRGSGLAGLRGMLPITPLDASAEDVPLRAPLLVIRPLLNTPRAAIDAYVAAHDLKPRIDSTNADTTYLRNRLRREVLPYLRQINPALDEALTHTAETARADYDALRDLLPTHDPPDRLARTHFATLPLSIQRMAIRERTRELRFDQVEALIAWIEHGTTGQRYALPGSATAQLTFTHIVFEPNARQSHEDLTDTMPVLDHTVDVSFPGSVTLPAGWVLEIHRLAPGTVIDPVGDDPLRAVLIFTPDAVLRLRPWRHADRFYPHGLNGHSQKLSDTLINMKVPAIWREHLPLLTINDQIAWFVAPTPTGLRARVAEMFAFRENERAIAWELRYHRVP